jgi:cell division protein FtsL
LNRPLKPTSRPSRVVAALLSLALVAAAFATLMVRLEVTQEGYRISALRVELRDLEIEDQRLRLEAARLSSHQRLHALAAKYGLRPPLPEHLVMMP